MERKAVAVIIAKAMFAEEPKRTMVMAKNVHQVVNWVVETPANAPKQEKRKLNPRLMGFEAKEGEVEKELVQRLNTKLLQGQMKLRAKVVAAMRQWPTATRASPLMVGTRPNTMLFKFATNEDRQIALQRRKGLDEDLTPAQRACKSKMWPLF
jgi:hypothetical protein